MPGAPAFEPEVGTPAVPPRPVTPWDGAWIALLTGMAAAWATRTEVLPGRTHGWWGATLEGVLWLLLYLGLRRAYYSVPMQDGESEGRRSRWLGLAMLLALVSTAACMRLFEARLAPASWLHFFYLRWFTPFVLVGVCCAALLRRETAALVRAARDNPGSAPLPALAVLLAFAALLISLGDLLLQGGGSSPVEARLREELIEPTAWATSTVLLFSAYATSYVVTRRLGFALLLVSPPYLALALASLAKLKYIHSAVQPLDLLRIPEFLPLFRSFFGVGMVLVTLTALSVWLVALVAARWLRPHRLRPWRRWCTGLLALAILLAAPAAFLASESHPEIKALLVRLGAPKTQHREQVRLSGFLLSFLSQLPAVLVSTPSGYSESAIASIGSRYPATAQPLPPGRTQATRINLVVYLVESFVDPLDLGYHYTTDPVPNFRAYSRGQVSGHAFVPERFSGSANTEFELLTGMTSSFLPEGSVAYRQYLRRPIPALPRLLHRLGYATTAIQADPKYYYDRERVYPLLGFDRVVWLQGAPGVEHAPRGPWPADQEVVAAVIEASRGRRPFFAFAFPSSTHSPYHFGTYAHADLDVIDPPSPESAKELKEYINAVRVADEAIGRLIEYFRRQRDSTMIVVLGDHLPPLSPSALRPFFAALAQKPAVEQTRRTHSVPLLIWANFDLPHEDVELGTNALPSYLLDLMGIPAPGLLGLSGAVRRAMPILLESGGGPEREQRQDNALTPQSRRLLEEYRLAQYDLLLGHQYLLREGSPANRAAAAAHR